MKKWLLLALCAVLALALTACGQTDDAQDAEAEIVGGWTEPEDGTVTEALQAIFDKALENYDGGEYAALELVGTQVVAGTNYRFLCSETGADVQKYVVVYEDLDGNCEITDVQDAE